MPFDSNGRFSLASGYLAVTGQTILASQHNPPLEDIASGLSSTLLRTGVAPMVADLPMGGFKVTNLAAGVANTDAVNVGQASALAVAAITSAATKAVPVDADTLPIVDSAAGNALKRITWANLKALFQPASTVLTALAGVGVAVAGDVIYATGAGTWGRLAQGTSGQSLRMNSAGTAPEWSISSGAPDAVLEDRKATGVYSGNFVGGAWRTRDLTTEVRDASNLITLSANAFTSTVSGWVEWSAPTDNVGDHQTRLFNVTDGAAAGWGTGEQDRGSSGSSSRGGCAVVAGKQYRLEHACSGSGSFGNDPGFSGSTVVYARVLFWRS